MPADLMHTNQRRLRVGVFSFFLFLSVAGLAGVASARVFCEFTHDSRGSVVSFVALLSPVMIGGMGLGAETGY